MGNTREGNIIISTRINTPLGEMIAGAVQDGICLLEFSDRKILTDSYNILSRYLKYPVFEGENEHTELLREELNQYFKGTLKKFCVNLVLTGTEFQKSVWRGLLNIPFGETCSYSKHAEAVNRPGSVRAVANANAMNKIAIAVPCHRIIGEDGSLTGYRGTLWRKKWLLDHESKYSGRAVDLSLF
jgi:AraC family transcriptional regulator of adaptative response/methylated-DNA-[protein]-cysteine methyltransferase